MKPSALIKSFFEILRGARFPQIACTFGIGQCAPAWDRDEMFGFATARPHLLKNNRIAWGWFARLHGVADVNWHDLSSPFVGIELNSVPVDLTQI